MRATFSEPDASWSGRRRLPVRINAPTGSLAPNADRRGAGVYFCPNQHPGLPAATGQVRASDATVRFRNPPQFWAVGNVDALMMKNPRWLRARSGVCLTTFVCIAALVLSAEPTAGAPFMATPRPHVAVTTLGPISRVHLGADGKLAYTPDASGAIVPEFSSCGYIGPLSAASPFPHVCELP